MPETLVKVEHLSKKFCRRLKRSLWYGILDIGAELTGSKRNRVKLRKEEFWALKDVGFEIRQGELVGLIGPNGAGKTTLLKLLSGLIKPDEGTITIKGKIQALIALGAGFNPILTGRENIYVNGAVLGFSKKDIDRMIEGIVEFAEIGEFIDMPVQSYSSGMQVRLGFSVAVNLKPNILIVDEVLAVGDASFKRKARRKMMDLLHSGISVIFVSHNMAQISAITSRCIYLRDGKIVESGPSDRVTERYLSDSFINAIKTENQDVNVFMASAHVTMPEAFMVRDVKIYNSSYEETETFKTFEDIKVAFELEFLKKTENVLLAINIRDQVNEMVISSSKMQLNSGPNRGIIKVECEIGKNKFREGNYNIGFYATEPLSGALFKSTAVRSFTILADMELMEKEDPNRGFMVMDTNWEVLD